MAIAQENFIMLDSNPTTISVKSRDRGILPRELLQELPPELRETPLNLNSELKAAHHLLVTSLSDARHSTALCPALITLAPAVSEYDR